MKRHRILAQIAGHDREALKLTPPLLAGQKEIAQIAAALDDVLTGCRNVTGPVWESAKELMRRSIRQGRESN
jgi:ornithine--oxo-acid transaminase